MKNILIAATLAATTVLGTLGAASAASAFNIQPGALSRGANPTIPHVEGHSVVDGSIRIKVATPHLELLGKSGSNYVISTRNAEFGNPRIWKLRPSGDKVLLLRGQSAENVKLSDQGATLVSATHQGNRSTAVFALDVASGGSFGVGRSFRGYVEPLDVDGPRVALGGWSRERTLLWNFKAHTTRTLIEKAGYFADLSSNQFAFYTKDPYLGGCSVLTHVSAPAHRIWKSCTERIDAMNPDGSRLATIALLSDGIGPNRVMVRTAGGIKLATYDVAGYFGTVQFEDRFKLLLDATGKKQAATVRCDLSGCERASELRPAQF